MSPDAIHKLDELLIIANEEDTPLSPRDIQFLEGLESRLNRDLTPAQGEWFDDLCRRHLGNSRC